MRNQAEANLSALIESTEDFIWSVDLDHRLIAFNSAFRNDFLATFGIQLAVGTRFEDLIPADRAGFWSSFYQRAISQGPFRAEHTLLAGRTFEFAFIPIVTEGKTTGISVFGKNITERNAAQESLRFLAAIVESSQDAILTYAPSGLILTWNRGAQAMFGYAADEACGKPLSLIVPPERKDNVQEYTAQVLAGTAIPQRQGTGLRKDGRRILISATSWPLRNHAGDVTAISMIIRDVTVRREADEARALLASIVESSDDAIHAVTLDGTVVSWNRGGEKLLGYSGAEIIGKHISVLAPPDRLDEVRQCFVSVQAGLPISPFDTVFQRKDGSSVDVSVLISPIRNADGELVGASAIARDISQRRQLERALAETETKYRDIFDGAVEGMFQTAPDGKIILSNPALAGMLRYDSPQDLQSSVASVVDDIWDNPDEHAEFLRQIAEHGAVQRFECRFRCKDGSILWASIGCRRVRSPNGDFLYHEGIIEDITARVNADESLRLSAESLAEAQRIGGLGSYMLDLPSQIWTSSQVLDEIFGIDAEYERNFTTWADLIHPDDRSMMIDYFQNEVLVQRKPFNKEYRIFRHNDHAECWVHGMGKLDFDAQGQPIRLHGVIRNITERKLTELQLQQSEERYRETFEQAAVGIVHTSLEGKFLRCNAHFAEIIGYSPEEIPGMNFKQITAPQDLAESLDILQQAPPISAAPAIREKRYLRKDGSITWVKITVSTQRDAEGNPLHYITVIQDINARKAIEASLASALQALSTSEERYRKTFQMSIDAVNINRLSDGIYVDVNPAFLDIIGYQREEVLGKGSLTLEIWADPADRLKLIEALKKDSVCHNLEARFRRKNGDLVWGLMSASLFELDGVPCVLSITRDITQAKATEERLASAARALQISEARYRTVFQTSLDCISISQLDDGKLIDVNKAFLDLLGFDMPEVIGRTSVELNLWDDPKARETMADVLRQTSSFRDARTRYRKKNGEMIWVIISSSLIEIEGVPCVLSIMRDISDAKAAEDKIWNLAFYDPLTRLPNRRLLMDRLRQNVVAGARSVRKRALLFIDLDNFKTLNDSLGHQNGDLLLQEVARRLVACVREADTVARLGGDEFVVMLEDLSEVAEDAAAQAENIGSKILSSIDRPYMLDGRECFSTSSIGITIFGGKRESTNDVLQQADIAMYQAKAAGRNTMRFFAPALQAAVQARAAMEDDLRQAVKADQFELYYQPQVNEKGLMGAEALVRWNHPRRDLLLPGEFIGLAEETGLILPLGTWVLEAACKQIAAWNKRAPAKQVSIAVNISARQFRQSDFVDQVLGVLLRTGAKPASLKLELTESMLFENIEEIIDKMNALRACGLRFALDDFGTGYSSLSYLKRLPLDQLKIDRSFVRDILDDIGSSAIAKSVISLGNALGLTVIAEGVETVEQRDFLTGLGCNCFQGYLFGRPIPPREFQSLWIDANAAPSLSLP